MHIYAHVRTVATPVTKDRLGAVQTYNNQSNPLFVRLSAPGTVILFNFIYNTSSVSCLSRCSKISEILSYWLESMLCTPLCMPFLSSCILLLENCRLETDFWTGHFDPQDLESTVRTLRPCSLPFNRRPVCIVAWCYAMPLAQHCFDRLLTMGWCEATIFCQAP